MTGCITGGLLGCPAGLWPAVMGCGGFAAFSFVIEAYMMAEHPPLQETPQNERNYDLMFE